MSDALQIISTLVLGGGGLIASLIAIFMVRANKGKVQADTKETEMRAVQLSDQIDAEHEKRWQEKFDSAQRNSDLKIAQLQDEVAWLKLLIENHVPWDWEVQRRMIQAGVEHAHPPTLNWIRGKTLGES